MQDRDGEQWTVLRLLNWTKDYFARRDVDQPRLSAEILLAHALNCRRIDLYARFDQVPAEQQRSSFRQMVLRAGRGEPVAYIVGSKEFYSLELKVTSDVLVPRPETEILVAEALGRLEVLARAGTMWDVCTGSGCVAVAVAVNNPAVTVLATDISPQAVALAGQNARTHGVAERVHCHVADLLNLPPQWSGPKRFDVITANPPYVADDDEVAKTVLHEPQSALRAGPEGMDYLRRIIRDAPAALADGGALIIEFGCGQADAVRELIVATGAFSEPRIIRDQQDIERTAVAIRTA